MTYGPACDSLASRQVTPEQPAPCQSHPWTGPPGVALFISGCTRWVDFPLELPQHRCVGTIMRQNGKENK